MCGWAQWRPRSLTEYSAQFDDAVGVASNCYGWRIDGRNRRKDHDDLVELLCQVPVQPAFVSAQ